MEKIPIHSKKYQNLFILIDDEDYNLVCRHRWWVVKDKNTYYAKTTIKVGDVSKTLKIHRLIMGLDFGDRRQIDHIDGNGLNNQKSNLRIASSGQNSMNKRTSYGSSVYKGVYWYKNYHKWCSTIRQNGKSIHLGYFDSEFEAAKAYDSKARELFGEFAKINFP